MKLLVEKGAQLNVEDSSGDTPMELACKNDFVKGEKIMIELNSKSAVGTCKDITLTNVTHAVICTSV